MEAEFSRIEIIGSMSKVSAFIEMLSSKHIKEIHKLGISGITVYNACLLYTSDAADEL